MFDIAHLLEGRLMRFRHARLAFVVVRQVVDRRFHQMPVFPGQTATIAGCQENGSGAMQLAGQPGWQFV